jgi:Ca-activated chloride channel family protein
MELTPRILPDVYAGEPLVLLGQTDRLGGTMTVSGRLGGRRWSQTLDLGKAVESPAVAKLWASRRIRDVETQRTLGRLDDDAADKAIASLGLAYSLVTRRTSLVAVDNTPSRPAGVGLRFEDLPINLPAGWDFDTLFEGAAGKVPVAKGAHKGASADDPAQAVDLPQTALNFEGALNQGLVLLLLGAIGLLLLRRRRQA